MKRRRTTDRHLLIGFGAMLAICNQHLLQGSSPSALIYKTDAVLQGEWWRLVTHLFVHVSWYHLFLDALAVILLWHEIGKFGEINKPILALTCVAGSLVNSILFSPYLGSVGYCGLSGLAHGLMVFLGLQWVKSYFDDKDERSLYVMGAGCLLLLLSGGKSILEVWSGAVLFTGLHVGSIGIPIVHAHLGGVIGGLAAFLFMKTQYDELNCCLIVNAASGGHEKSRKKLKKS